ncbi:PREDICTED: F-box/LRR-repeat protein At2g43260-like [Camelina sativa]|uniref:F-box/LRR-repeat protein At2g43260-like n=1 Tax=Camelina sativa TaxID=90675 RepID=A0ABM0SLC4_CAMSA|nr:PREDICTED: F-box/LRR-repeat protein At2g43260-like [Camelina sativa]
MGFGRDKVTGSFKVIKMCICPMEGGCDVLDVESGEWTNLRLYPYVVGVSRKSVCVSGSIYWLSCASYKIGGGSKILALDLHTQESHFVSVPDKWVSRYTHMANLEDRLTIATTRAATTLEICSMDANQEIWSKTYSIALAALDDLNLGHSRCLMSFTPLAVSKQGNLLFYNNDQWLFIYYPETHEIRCLSSDTSVVSSYVENLVPLRSEFGHQPPDPDSNKISTSSCSFLTKHPDPRTSVYHSNYSLKLSNICLW